MTALVQLAGAISHELNNIFTAVAGNLSLLDDHIERDSMQAEMIGDVIRTAQRGIALSAKLQAFAGRQPLKRKITDLRRLLADVAVSLQQTLPRSVTVGFAFDDVELHAFVDEERLCETIKELAANAVVAMSSVGHLQIEIRQRVVAAGEIPGLRAGTHAEIRVTDTGSGMAPEVMARALDPMFSTKASHINAGWGLSNSAGFACQSGGAMKIHSEQGRGSRIELYLPCDTAPAGAARQRAVPGARDVA